jgi:hypothetical protein
MEIGANIFKAFKFVLNSVKFQISKISVQSEEVKEEKTSAGHLFAQTHCRRQRRLSKTSLIFVKSVQKP